MATETVSASAAEPVATRLLREYRAAKWETEHRVACQAIRDAQ